LEAGESCGLVTANVGNSSIFFLEENRNVARVFVDLFERGKLGQVDPHVRTMIFSLFLGYTDASIMMEMLVKDAAGYAIDKGAPDDSPEFTTYSAEYYNTAVRDPTIIEKYKVKLEKAKSLIREIMNAYGKMGML
jgi:hypothetical protein